MKHGLCKGIVALFLMAAMLVGVSALAEGVIDGGLTDAQEVVKEVGEVDLYAPVVYAGTEQEDAGEKEEQAVIEHNDEYYYEIDSTFPDAVFRSEIKEYIDLDNDGYLSKEECIEVTDIMVDNLGISDLDGIYVFENLEYLNCSDNQIKKLDVSDNIHLIGVYCDDNQINTILLPASDSLKYVSCMNNMIKALDVSANENLEELSCDNNGMERLWLPQSGKMEVLTCQNNKLTSLHLDNNRMLHILYINNNKIESVDISDCNELIDLIEREYNFTPAINIVSWGETRWLELSSTRPVYGLIIDRDMRIFESNRTVYAPLVVEIDSKYFPADDFRDYVLEECDTNEDEWLDVDEIESVAEILLYSDNCDIDCPSLKGIEYFTNLVNLNCCGCGIKSINLSKNRKLAALYLDGNKLTKLDLSKNTMLEYLGCSDNNLSKLDMRKQTKLKYLDCANNRIKNLYLGSHKKLDVLYACGNKLKKIDIKNCPKLRKNLKLKKEVHDGMVSWIKYDKEIKDYMIYLYIDTKTKLTAGSKVLYSRK